ncbi:MKRN2 opposite strand protein [Parasteatoda tepidariorum]|uniref:MKRN2 opposite strand protein n=1 Tax=Parasteatoda tepidariorum TaxID=114398 RepID=UPI00077FE36A|nr:MKRN2 opposite strand protein [Parasteatoda tepidariorum]
MDVDPGIICYQHCHAKKKIFSFIFHDVCDLCHADISDVELRVPPFRIPYPFKGASHEFNSVVIKPSVGDFLNSYENSSDLHIGVTDTNGCVFEYNYSGKLKSNGKDWKQCIAIKLSSNKSSSFQRYWDEVLNETFEQECWTPQRYDSENYNCYTFVLTFLRRLKMDDLSPFIADKYSFCQHYVSPQARIAAKYISLYRQLKTKSVIIQ